MHIPPLRERPADIPLLAGYFLRKCGERLGLPFKKLAAGASRTLTEYRWPGNAREVDNIIQRAVLLSADAEITEEEMRSILGAPAGAGQVLEPDLLRNPELLKRFSLQETLERITGQVEQQIIQQALDAEGGKRQETADLLKISRKSLHNKMKKYRIE
jgi:DNA-binding NtrC family response regulator